MPKPYSYDLRSKAICLQQRFAIAAYHSGKKKIEISRYFNISRNTLDLWLKQEAETGDYHPKKPGIKENHGKIKNLEEFQIFVDKNKGKTQKEMAKLWGQNMTQQNISYGCKKLGITRKKNVWLSRKR
ncbi:MAG: hypothetical protein F6K62_26650 [Sphaerospermopsis sp. SIO1G2]|nr:hypothetical protein [Sphaerospermopsis sp. SIO1G2]